MSQKFDFAHIFMVDRLGHDKNYWIVFLAKYPYISKKYANYQILLKSVKKYFTIPRQISIYGLDVYFSMHHMT